MLLHGPTILLAAFFSFSAIAGASLADKEMKVETLDKLNESLPAIDVEDYKRELKYDERGLSLDARAQEETNLFVSKMRQQITKAYEASLKATNNPEESQEEVREAFRKDLELADPELKDEIESISEETLRSIDSGSTQKNIEAPAIRSSVLKQVIKRNKFLNKTSADSSNTQDPNQVNGGLDISSYKSEQEVIDNLVSEGANSGWYNGNVQWIKNGETVTKASGFAAQVKVEFLGSSFEGGPTLSFNKYYTTSVTIIADGLQPAVTNEGRFDFAKRDKNGNPVMKDGKLVKRFLAFLCNAEVLAETTMGLEGTLKLGVGAGLEGVAKATGVLATTQAARKTYSYGATLGSKRLVVPEDIAGKTPTVAQLANICKKGFLNAPVTNVLTVKDSLDVLIENIISGLEYSHPKTKCAVDAQCGNWFNTNVINLARRNNFPRCVEVSSQDKYMACELRGLKNQKCAVYDSKGKRESDGMFEFKCDTGLKCQKTKEAGWFTGWSLYQSAEGKCVPVNARKYKTPTL